MLESWEALNNVLSAQRSDVNCDPLWLGPNANLTTEVWKLSPLSEKSSLSWQVLATYIAQADLSKSTNSTQPPTKCPAVIYLQYQSALKKFDGKCHVLPGPLMWELSSLQKEELYCKKRYLVHSSECQHNVEGKKSEAAHITLQQGEESGQ